MMNLTTQQSSDIQSLYAAYCKYQAQRKLNNQTSEDYIEHLVKTDSATIQFASEADNKAYWARQDASRRELFSLLFKEWNENKRSSLKATLKSLAIDSLDREQLMNLVSTGAKECPLSPMHRFKLISAAAKTLGGR